MREGKAPLGLQERPQSTALPVGQLNPPAGRVRINVDNSRDVTHRDHYPVHNFDERQDLYKEGVKGMFAAM